MGFIQLKELISCNFSDNLEFCEIFNSIHICPKRSSPESVFYCNTGMNWTDVHHFFQCFCKDHNLYEPIINSSLVVSLPQLVDHKFMEALYYSYGYKFCFFIIIECELLIKWGSNSFICLSEFKSKFTSPQYLYTRFYKKALIVQSNGYNMDFSLKMHKMLYGQSPLKKSSSFLIPVKTIDELKSRIMEMSVGQEICELRHFGKNVLKVLNKILFQNPSIKECQKMLDSIVQSKENIVPVNQVIQFITKVLISYVPCNIFGHKKYFEKYIKNIQQLLKFSRRQEGTLGFLLKGVIKKSELWRKNLTAKIALWIFHSFIIRVLCKFFYVSEIDKGNTLVFIKRAFWMSYMKECLDDMISMNQLIEISRPSSKECIRVLRFLPKLQGRGYRPVIRKSAWDTRNEKKLEICNTFLKQVIAAKCNKFPQHIDNLQKSWLIFLSKKKKNKSFFVKTDIKDAYGSIIHEKLKSILNLWLEGIPEKLELLCFTFNGRFARPEYLQQFVNLPPCIGKKILSYKPGKDKIISLTELKTLIFHYIDNIIVSCPTGKKCYRICKGLHQGGKLSAALCEAYYSALDSQYFNTVYNLFDGDMFLRVVDDYMFISTCKEKILKFLEIVVIGIAEYGVEVQLEKTLSNVGHHLLPQSSILETSVIPFFGYLFEIEKGFIKLNLEKYKGVNIRSSLFLKKFDISVLETKLTYIESLNLQKIVLNPEYQTKRILFETIHTAACILAFKFVSITYFLSMAEVKLKEEYLMECILKGITAIAQCSSQKAKPLVKFPEAKKTCIKSFILILRKKNCFSKLVKGLERQEQKLHIFSKRNVKIIKAVTKKIHQCFITTEFENLHVL